MLALNTLFAWGGDTLRYTLNTPILVPYRTVAVLRFRLLLAIVAIRVLFVAVLHAAERVRAGIRCTGRIATDLVQLLRAAGQQVRSGFRFQRGGCGGNSVQQHERRFGR